MPDASRARIFHGWWIVLVALVAMFAATLTGGSGLSIFVLPIAADLGWDRGTIAGALGLGTVLGALTAPLFGRLVDRYGARVMLTATGVGLGLSLVPIAWVQTPLFFYLGYSTARLIDMAVLNTAATTAVANWFVRLRGRALGLTVAGNAIGVALVTPIAQWIIDGWGWRAAWLAVSSSAVLLLTPLAWWLVRRRPEDLGLQPDGDLRPGSPREAEAGVSASAEVNWPLAAAIRTSAFWLLVVSGALNAFAVSGMSLHQVPILVGNGLDAGTVAWLVSLYGLTWTAGSIGWGFVAERVPTRFALAVGYLLAGTCMLLVLQARDLPSALLYATIFGVTNGGKETLDAVVWADYYGRRSVGAIRGFSRPLIVGGIAGGGYAGGRLFDTLGSYELAVSLYGALAIAGGLLVVLARPPVAKGRERLGATLETA